MCLYPDQFNARIAEEDIVCYKYLKPSSIYHGNVDENYFYSPCVNKRICRKDKIIEYLQSDPWWKRPLKMREKNSDYLSICGGAIHTFSNLVDMAKLHSIDRQFYTENMQKFDDYAYFKCIIPKGTKYWIQCDKSQYASKKIVYKEKIDLNTNSEAIEYYKSRYGEPISQDAYDKMMLKNREKKHQYKKKRKRAAKKH